MSEFADAVGTLYHMGTGALPWVIVVLVISACLYYRKDVSSYIQERAKAQKAIAEREAERNEIIRNNSAVIENCTVVLQQVTNEREKITTALGQHEDMSKERMERIQDVVEQCKTEISKARAEHAVLIDRN